MEKYVYVILSQTKSKIGKTLRWFMKYKYNHASISLDQNLKQMYSFGRISANNPLVGGMIKENLHNFTLGNNNIIETKIYRISVNDMQYEKISRFIKETYNDRDGYYYNLLGLLGIIFRKKWRLYKTYICSEFIVESLKSGEIEIIQKNRLISPKDMGKVMEHLLYYEGDLYRYPHLVSDFSHNYDENNNTYFNRTGFRQETYRTIKHCKMLIWRHYKNGRGKVS